MQFGNLCANCFFIFYFWRIDTWNCWIVHRMTVAATAAAKKNGLASYWPRRIGSLPIGQQELDNCGLTNLYFYYKCLRELFWGFFYQFIYYDFWGQKMETLSCQIVKGPKFQNFTLKFYFLTWRRVSENFDCFLKMGSTNLA